MNTGNNNNNKYIHSKRLLGTMVAKIGTVDFRSLCNNLSPSAKQYRIVIIKQLLAEMRHRGWDLGYKDEKFYGYNGASWWEYTKDDINWLLFSASEKMGVRWDYACDAEFTAKLLDQFMLQGILQSDGETSDSVLVNFENGTYEITQHSRRLRDHKSGDNLHYQLPFSYDPDGSSPMFHRFLEEVLPDRDCQNILAEFIGYVFTKNIKLEKALLLYGSGANGKSVFFDIINALLGRHNCSSYTLFSLTDDKGYSRAKIADKLVNYCSEISSKMDKEMFKILVSTESIEARLPYKDPFNMENYAKLIFNCNSLPKEVENNNAFFRRFIIIPFTQTIPVEKQDKELAKKIIASELPGIFNWVMEGLDRVLRQKGFSKCDVAETAVEKYKKESDSVQVFIEEFGYERSETDYIKQYELHDRYTKFCRRAGLNPLGTTNFGKRLDDLAIVRKNLKFGKAVCLKQDPLGLQELLNMISTDKGL